MDDVIRHAQGSGDLLIRLAGGEKARDLFAAGGGAGVMGTREREAELFGEGAAALHGVLLVDQLRVVMDRGEADH